MTNRRQIPFFHWTVLPSGELAGDWKPSPRLRALGWTNRRLGRIARRGDPGEDAIVQAALALNRQLGEWQQAGKAAAPPVQRRQSFADLVLAYKASPAWSDIAAATRREYDLRLRQLTFWANDGQLALRMIDRQMVHDLKTALLADGGSRFKAAATLRVLRLVLRWARGEGWIASDPTETVPFPTPPSRATRLDWRCVDAAATLAGAGSIPARYLRIAFWSMQRREDVAQLNRFAWRQLHGADPRDLPALVNDRGEVWGFRLQQQKTGRHVDCPMPPFLHAEIVAAFGKSEWLFPHSLDPRKAMGGDVLRRYVKPALDAAGFAHVQLRDLRRSGMSWTKDMGAMKADVFAISGHPLDGQTRTMADVYMPPDTMAACRAIAAAERTRRHLEQQEKQADAD